MRILFIGGNGNISWYCTQKAIDAGHEVYILNRGETLKTRRKIQPQVHKLTGNIRNHKEMKELLKDMTFDVVADFICYDSKQAEFDIELFKNKTKQFIYISSVVVYKRASKYLPYKENTPQWSDTDYDYAYDKVKAEKIFMDAYKNDGFPVTIVRPAHTYDTIMPVPLGHNCFTAPQRYLDGHPVLIAGDGTNIWSLLHSADFANAFLGLLGNEKTIGEDFHITADSWINWLEITEALMNALSIKEYNTIHIPVGEILNLKVPVSKNMAISYLGKAFRGQRMWCDIYDNSKIKKFVPGWKQEISFEDGIKQTVDWLMEDGARRRINPEMDKLLEELENKYGK